MNDTRERAGRSSKGRDGKNHSTEGSGVGDAVRNRELNGDHPQDGRRRRVPLAGLASRLSHQHMQPEAGRGQSTPRASCFQSGGRYVPQGFGLGAGNVAKRQDVPGKAARNVHRLHVISTINR